MRKDTSRSISQAGAMGVVAGFENMPHGVVWRKETVLEDGCGEGTDSLLL